jgi:hypothetical protein
VKTAPSVISAWKFGMVVVAETSRLMLMVTGSRPVTRTAVASVRSISEPDVARLVLVR